MIIGVDEVGRGCLAGDLVVCAFALRPDLGAEDKDRLREAAMDSKAFRDRRRREGAADLVKGLGVYEIARSSPEDIDRMNIRVATLDAMSRAARALADRISAPCTVLFDGRDIPSGFDLESKAVIKGDASILEISCASIIAKTLRDREMVEAAISHPGYGFEQHAGYGTSAHREAIQRLGLSSIHRSWARRFLA